MKLLKQWKSLLAAICMIAVIFVLFSFLDIAIAFFFSRFYSRAAFIVIFGIGGIFAAVFAYVFAIRFASEKNEWARWTLILAMIAIGLLFFFYLSQLEGGEYRPPFKAFGATLALGSLLFVKGKVEV